MTTQYYESIFNSEKVRKILRRIFVGSGTIRSGKIVRGLFQNPYNARKATTVTIRLYIKRNFQVFDIIEYGQVALLNKYLKFIIKCLKLNLLYEKHDFYSKK